MVGQYCGSKEKEWKVTSLRGLHKFKQGLSERSLPHASHRPAGWRNRRPSSDELLICLSRVPSNIASTRGSGKTVFVTPTGNYHYKVMPFGLKNTGSTYQRMMTMMFEPQLGKNIEVYIDDIVVKSKEVFNHMDDLGNIFGTLRKHKLCLNASKCSFGVGSGKFLATWWLIEELKLTPIKLR